MSSIEFSVGAARDSVVAKYVSAFETAIANWPDTRLVDYLPSDRDPRYLSVLVELIQKDMDISWRSLRPKAIDHYRERFPRAFLDAGALTQIAFLEYRLRRTSGEPATIINEYRSRYQIDADDWESRFGDARHHTDTKTPGRSRTLFSNPMRPPQITIDDVEPGSVWGDFEIVAELGKGAFGKAWLAKQQSLAGRLVVLKFADLPSQEAQRLALLQHTNIVPIYSVHEPVGDSTRSVICMPFSGHTTVASLLRNFGAQIPESGSAIVEAVKDDSGTQPNLASVSEAQRFMNDSSYLHAVLWIVERLADGLEHAHGRGVIHRDIKPANILLRNDAEPQLLDFNLAVSVDRDLTQPDMAGGTIPYMAPEQIASFLPREEAMDELGNVDARSDVYSLGVVLYEMITGFAPWEPSAAPISPSQLIEERRAAPKAAGSFNASVTPAVEAIMSKCFTYDINERYQSAGDLRDDLRRHLQNQPLIHVRNDWKEKASKWIRRNPSLFSFSTAAVAAMIGLLVVGLGWTWRESQVASARATHALYQFSQSVKQLTPELSAVQLDAIESEKLLDDATEVAATYQVADAPGAHSHWDSLSPAQKRQWRQQAGTLSWLLALAVDYEATQSKDGDVESLRSESMRWNRTAARWIGGENKAVKIQHARLNALVATSTEPKHPVVSQPAPNKVVSVPLEDLLVGIEHFHNRKWQEAESSFKKATRNAPQDSTSWLMLGETYLRLGRHANAEACFDVSQTLLPESIVPEARKGECLLRQKKYAQAVDSFSAVLRQYPDRCAALLNRALSYIAIGKDNLALQDLNTALEDDSVPTRAYFIRSRLHRRLGNTMEARTDAETGLRKTPNDVSSWVARGVARIRREPQGALEDFEQALELAPYCQTAMHNIAHVCAESLKRNDQAIEILGRAIESNPDDAVALAGRAVMYARAGSRELAMADALQLQRMPIDPVTRYQIGCVYALLLPEAASVDADQLVWEALNHLSLSFVEDLSLVTLADGDPDLGALADNEHFQSMTTLFRQFSRLPSQRSLGAE